MGAARQVRSQDKPPSGTTVLMSGPLGHRSMTLSLPGKTWTTNRADFLAQDRYLPILRPADRAEAAEFLQNRFAVHLPSEEELVRFYRDSEETLAG